MNVRRQTGAVPSQSAIKNAGTSAKAGAGKPSAIKNAVGVCPRNVGPSKIKGTVSG